MSNIVREVKDAVDELAESQRLWQERQEQELKAVQAERAQDRERLEQLESRASSPGRTGAMSTKEREHLRIFCKALRGKFADPSSLIELGNIQADLGYKDVTIGTGAAGGFAVPEIISREVERLELLFSPVRRLVKVVQASSSDFKVLVSKRGTTSGWVGETGTRSATLTPTLRERAPTHGELYAYPAASNWSLDDVMFSVADWLAEEVAQEFAQEEGIAVISGNGTSRPTGMLNTAPSATADFASPERAPAAYMIGATSDLTPGGQSILPDSLIDMVFSLNASYRSRATWVMNSSTAAHVRKLKDTTNQYLWAPGLMAGQPDRLLGYPVEIWENVPSIGANTFPVGFGDWQRAYVLVDLGGGLRITRDDVTTPGYTKYYVRRRVGGCPLDNHAARWLNVL